MKNPNEVSQKCGTSKINSNQLRSTSPDLCLTNPWAPEVKVIWGRLSTLRRPHQSPPLPPRFPPNVSPARVSGRASSKHLQRSTAPLQASATRKRLQVVTTWKKSPICLRNHSMLLCCSLINTNWVNKINSKMLGYIMQPIFKTCICIQSQHLRVFLE